MKNEFIASANRASAPHRRLPCILVSAKHNGDLTAQARTSRCRGTHASSPSAGVATIKKRPEEGGRATAKRHDVQAQEAVKYVDTNFSMNSAERQAATNHERVMWNRKEIRHASPSQLIYRKPAVTAPSAVAHSAVA